jgi:hypothetical protein
MNELLVGYARVSTEQQDLPAQRNGLRALGVGDDRIYVDHGLTGTNRDRPGLRLALAACRAGDTLVVTKLDLGCMADWLFTAPSALSAAIDRRTEDSLCMSGPPHSHPRVGHRRVHRGRHGPTDHVG